MTRQFGAGGSPDVSDDTPDVADETVVASGVDDGNDVADGESDSGSKGGPGSGPNKRALGIAIGVVCVVVVGIAVGMFVMFGMKKQVEVPDLYLQSHSDAERMLKDSGLRLGNVSEEAFDGLDIGDIVWKQSIKAGDKVDEGTAVDVVVSIGADLNGTTKVPDLTGMTPEKAEDLLLDNFIIPVPGEPVYSDTVEPGLVCAQSIAADSDVAMFEVLTYATSLGHEKVKVPNVTGKTLAEAREAFASAGVSLDDTATYSDSVDKDVIISQSIAADTEVDKGSVVTVERSLGPAPKVQVLVPDILTYKLDDAKRTLESAGLAYKVTGEDGGTVATCVPAPGQKVEQGSTVEIRLVKPQVVQVRDAAAEKKAADDRVKAEQDRQVAERERQEAEKARRDANQDRVQDNNLSSDEVTRIMQDSGRDAINDMQKVTIGNVEYWRVTAAEPDGSTVAWLVDPNGNLSLE